MFADRADAGRRLAEELLRRHVSADVTLGIARGGIVVGWEVARALGGLLSVLVVRKLPFPDNPEAGFGAAAEDGSLCLLRGAAGRLPRRLIREILSRQTAELRRRVRVLRHGAPLPDLRGRAVILADDGIAMGSTALAAVKCCRRLGARRVVVAAPVASPEALSLLEEAADEVVVLASPPEFRAVAQFYDDWRDVPDEEVLRIVDRTACHEA
ncbi:MAG: phosphoribosyltransferase [Elusimicrobia bacterium]|nr:phosphoribosyltransferase [Elusimicrobiota bacterium]